MKSSRVLTGKVEGKYLPIMTALGYSITNTSEARRILSAIPKGCWCGRVNCQDKTHRYDKFEGFEMW